MRPAGGAQIGVGNRRGGRFRPRGDFAAHFGAAGVGVAGESAGEHLPGERHGARRLPNHRRVVEFQPAIGRVLVPLVQGMVVGRNDVFGAVAGAKRLPGEIQGVAKAGANLAVVPVQRQEPVPSDEKGQPGDLGDSATARGGDFRRFSGRAGSATIPSLRAIPPRSGGSALRRRSRARSTPPGVAPGVCIFLFSGW